LIRSTLALVLPKAQRYALSAGEAQSLSKVFETKEDPLLRKVPKKVVAVEGISFSVPKGEIFGLLGLR
jgi:ABC-type oligopeptide transport system ATPase subunit